MDKEQLEKILKSNSNYWERRSLEGKINAIENEDDYLRRLESFYNQANKQIDEKLAKIYLRYAKENKITMKQAYKILPKAMEQEYKNDVIDYLEKAESNSSQYKSYLLNQSIMHKHSVLDQLRTEIRNAIYNIDINNTQGKFLSKIFQNSNYYMQYSGNENFAKIDPNKIQQVLEQNWSGNGSFSETIWKNKDKLVKTLDDVMIEGIAIGQSYDKIADNLAKKMETSKSNAKRLIVTEAARMDTEGKIEYYRSTGVKELINIATLDLRTSEICQHIDGTIIPIDQAKIGLNIPPFHPYCRTVISPHYSDNEIKERIYRDPKTNKTKIGKNRTYEEYLEQELKDKNKAEAISSTKNDLQTLLMAVNNNNQIYDKGTNINDYKNEIYNIQNKEYEAAESLNNKYNEEFLDNKFEKIKKLIEDKDNEYSIRIKEESLNKVLDSGEFKNQFSTLTNQGTYNPEWRKIVENNLFNIKTNAKDIDRPIYRIY